MDALNLNTIPKLRRVRTRSKPAVKLETTSKRRSHAAAWARRLIARFGDTIDALFVLDHPHLFDDDKLAWARRHLDEAKAA